MGNAEYMGDHHRPHGGQHTREDCQITISAMSPICKILMVVMMMTIVDQSTSTVSFERLGAQKDNLIQSLGGIKQELLSPVAGLAKGIFGVKKSIVQPIIGIKSNLARGILRPVAGIARSKLQAIRGLLDAKINKL